MAKPHTNGYWQNPLPVCHLRLETLQNSLCLRQSPIVRYFPTQRPCTLHRADMSSSWLLSWRAPKVQLLPREFLVAGALRA